MARTSDCNHYSDQLLSYDASGKPLEVNVGWPMQVEVRKFETTNLVEVEKRVNADENVSAQPLTPRFHADDSPGLAVDIRIQKGNESRSSASFDLELLPRIQGWHGPRFGNDNTVMLSTLIGNSAPSFELPCTRYPDPSRTCVTLEDYRGRWLLLLFYPRDFSLVCPTELIGLSQRYEEFEKHQCDILGVSCDPVESHERWMATPVARGGLGGLNFPAGQRPGRLGL